MLSDILNAIGIADFSLLDALCWVTAVPVTIAYKIATAIEGDARAPFPEGPEATFLATVTDFESLQAAFAPRARGVGVASAVAASEGEGHVAVQGIIPTCRLPTAPQSR